MATIFGQSGGRVKVKAARRTYHQGSRFKAISQQSHLQIRHHRSGLRFAPYAICRVMVMGVQEMATLINYWMLVRGWEEGDPIPSPEVKAEALKALQRIADLKEQASYSALWIYTYESAEDPHTNGLRGTLFEVIELDSTILNYTLPLFRYRVALITEQFRVRNMEPGHGSCEMWGLIKHLLTWGDEKDKEALREMLRLLEANGQDNYGTREKSKDLWKWFRMEAEGKFPNYLKERFIARQRPVWENMAYGSTNDRISKLQAASAGPCAPMQMKQSLVVSHPKAEPDPAIVEPHERGWLVSLLVVIAATLGTARLLLRKRS